MLDFRQHLLNMLPVVVVNQSDRPSDFFVAELLAMVDQAVANHVGNGQRTITVALLASHQVQLNKEFLGQGNAEPGYMDFLHFSCGYKVYGSVSTACRRSYIPITRSVDHAAGIVL